MISKKSMAGISAIHEDNGEEDAVKCTTASAPVDLVFLVDCSGSVGNAGHDASQEFVKNVVKGLPLGTGTLDTRVAVVQFSSGQYSEISLADGTSEQLVLDAVDGMTYHGGGTYTADAIAYASSTTFSGARSDAIKLLAVIADGKSSGNPKPAADTARSGGVQFVAIGVGDGID